MARTVDKTKKSNIKCEHCEFWRYLNLRPDPYAHEGFSCSNPDSPHYRTERDYYCRCKCFAWKERYNKE